MRNLTFEFKKYSPLVFIIISLLAIQLYIVVFLSRYNTFSCSGNYCSEQTKIGFFGNPQYRPLLKRDDIVDITVKSKYHRKRSKF